MADSATHTATHKSDAARRQVVQRGSGAEAQVETGGSSDYLHTHAGNRAMSSLADGFELPDGLRSEMESRFGTSFGDVRVHSGGIASSAASNLDANAFTVGHHIAFADAQYQPESMHGRRLLAHELAHVVQQRRGGAVPAMDSTATHERGADAAASAYASGASSIGVVGATGVGIARDEKKKKRSATFYQNALFGNRYWYWNHSRDRIEDWPVDAHLKTLWDSLGIPADRNGKSALGDQALAAKAEFIEFADTVAEFQKDNLPNVDPSFEGAVHPATAAKLRERNQRMARASKREFVVTTQKEAPAAAASGKLSGIGTVSAGVGTVSGSATATSTSLWDRATSAAMDPLGTVNKAADRAKEFVKSVTADQVEAIVLKLLRNTIDLPGAAGARLLAAFAAGMAKQFYKELIDGTAGRDFIDRFLHMGVGDAGQLYKGYLVGLLEGLVSPVSDLFGLVVLGESIKNMLEDGIVRLLTGPGNYQKEWQELLVAAQGLGGSMGEFWKELHDNTAKVLLGILQAPEALDAKAMELADGLGRQAASAIVSGAEAPWKGEKKQEAEPDPVKAPAAYVEHLAKAGEDYVIDTPWAKLGLKVGYAVGFVAVQVLLLVFTSGIGNGVLKVSNLLGKVGSLLGELGKLGKAVGTAVEKVAELGRALGEGIEFLEKGAAKLLEAAIKKMPFLGKVLGPVGELFEKLQKFLKKLFGVVDTEGAAAIDAAVNKIGKGAPKELPAPKPPALPPPAEPHGGPPKSVKPSASSAVADDAAKGTEPLAQRAKAKKSVAPPESAEKLPAKADEASTGGAPDETKPATQQRSKKEAADPSANEKPASKPRAKKKVAVDGGTESSVSKEAPKAKPKGPAKVKTPSAKRPAAPKRGARVRIEPQIKDPHGMRQDLTNFDRQTAGTGGIDEISFLKDPEGSYAVKIKGRLKDGLYRGKGPTPAGKVRAPNYNRSSKFVSNKEAGLDSNWENAHLWGPGFGDEAAAGMMKAPKSLNQWYQNQGVEGWMRDLRKAAPLGSTIDVEATAIARDMSASPWQPQTQVDFLKQVEYKVTVTVPGQPPLTLRVNMEVPPPPVDVGKIVPEFFPEGAANPADLFNINKGTAATAPTGVAGSTATPASQVATPRTGVRIKVAPSETNTVPKPASTLTNEASATDAEAELEDKAIREADEPPEPKKKYQRAPDR